MYDRILDLRKLVARRSLFLFGPRMTGKSTLVRQTFPQADYFDLLEADTFRELSARPEYMRQTLRPSSRVVVIDEVQKLPSLLDEVHLLIERDKRLRFVLTGSSARKLKRGGANLLAGRARVCRLHPLVADEIPSHRLLDRINRGSLPAILDSDEYREGRRRLSKVSRGSGNKPRLRSGSPPWSPSSRRSCAAPTGRAREAWTRSSTSPEASSGTIRSPEVVELVNLVAKRADRA